MNYSSHLVLSMLLKNTSHMWYSSLFEKELGDVYRGEGSILMLLWHKLEQLRCSVIFGLDFIQHYSRDDFTQFLLHFFLQMFFVVVGLWVVCRPSTPISSEFLMLSSVTSPLFLVHMLQGRPMILRFGGRNQAVGFSSTFFEPGRK